MAARRFACVVSAPNLFDPAGGKRFISLAISEAHAGSDVAGIQTTATLTPDGSHFIVNGSKKCPSPYSEAC